MRMLMISLLALGCASDPSTDTAVAPPHMTIDALEWAQTSSEARFYIEAHLVECESGAELKAFTSETDQEFQLVADGEAPTLLSCGVGGRTSTSKGKTSCSLMLFPRHDGWRPAAGRTYRLLPLNRDDDHSWAIAPGLELHAGE